MERESRTPSIDAPHHLRAPAEFFRRDRLAGCQWLPNPPGIVPAAETFDVDRHLMASFLWPSDDRVTSGDNKIQKVFHTRV